MGTLHIYVSEQGILKVYELLSYVYEFQFGRN